MLVTGHYYVDLVQKGTAIRWTTASFTLAARLRSMQPERVFITDWGILETVDLLTLGKLPLVFGDEFSAPSLPGREPALRQAILGPHTVFVTHVPECEQLQGRLKALDNFASRAGARRHTLAIIQDDQGRPAFVILQFTAPD